MDSMWIEARDAQGDDDLKFIGTEATVGGTFWEEGQPNHSSGDSAFLYEMKLFVGDCSAVNNFACKAFP